MESTTEELKDNTLIVVLGASGDLAKKKTYPALFGLFKLGFLPNDIHIVGYARTKMDDAQYPRESNFIEEFKAISSCVSGAYDDDGSFKNLDKFLNSIESQYRRKRDQAARVYFLYFR